MSESDAQVRDFGDMSYLVKRNYVTGMRQLMRRAQPVPASRLDPQRDDFLEVCVVCCSANTQLSTCGLWHHVCKILAAGHERQMLEMTTSESNPHDSLPCRCRQDMYIW